MSGQFRVLDLGCGDGTVGAWLTDRLTDPPTRARGVLDHLDRPAVEVCGVELDEQAAAVARARGVDCKVGRAEHAPHLFEPGTFDAVVAFELIEHVPDPAALLSAAERMLKPDGLVYISTPDGTFGEGQNPNHLRVYRSVDLADVLRRRGRLESMGVGSDRVTFAAYKPTERYGDIAIYTGPSWEPWQPQDIATRGLGGSETAAVRLAEELSALGYVVTVYADTRVEGVYRDVIFRHWSTYDPTHRRLAVIASRLPEVYDRPQAAQATFLWVHDVDCGPRLTPTRADRIDHVLVLSEWHERHVADTYPWLAGRFERGERGPSRLRRIRNGINLPDFAAGGLADRERRVLFTSSPDRGLDLLLELWPDVRAEVPDAVLAHAYAAVYDQVAEHNPVIRQHRDRIRALADQPGVEPLGSLSQPEIAALMRRSLVWAHPSWNTPGGERFHETSCIGAMEAQAAGCLVVAAQWGALPETVRAGRLIPEPANTPEGRAAFVREIVDGLVNMETQAWAQREGPRAVADLGWAGVALDVERLIRGERVG